MCLYLTRNLHVLIFRPEGIECDTLLVDMAFNTSDCSEVITDISMFDMTVNIPVLCVGLNLFPLLVSFFFSCFLLCQNEIESHFVCTRIAQQYLC